MRFNKICFVKKPVCLVQVITEPLTSKSDPRLVSELVLNETMHS